MVTPLSADLASSAGLSSSMLTNKNLSALSAALGELDGPDVPSVWAATMSPAPVAKASTKPPVAGTVTDGKAPSGKPSPAVNIRTPTGTDTKPVVGGSTPPATVGKETHSHGDGASWQERPSTGALSPGRVAIPPRLFMGAAAFDDSDGALTTLDGDGVDASPPRRPPPVTTAVVKQRSPAGASDPTGSWCCPQCCLR